MTKREIQNLLEARYDRERWKKLITEVFRNPAVFGQPLERETTTVEGRRHVQRILQFGDVALSDGNQVALFEVEVVQGKDLGRNRVAIRKAIEQPVKQGGHSGALISFVDPGTGIWRFSFFSNRLTEAGTWDANNPKRYTYLLGEGEKCRTAAEQFEGLANKAGQVTLKDLLEAFSVEKVSKAFFKEYKEHYQDFVAHLTGKRMVKKGGKWEEQVMHPPSPKLAAYFNGNEKDARDFCKKLMGRLVFLYFLQKKRWLGATTADYADGEPDFVYRLFRAQGSDVFYPNVLVPLFFETLNAERPGDAYPMPDGGQRKVPFLNGGLFDMDVLDRKTRLLTFPPELFSNPAKADEEKERGFLDFLNAYNFTVHEAGPEEQTLAVDPEMLGHIFENLLEDNKDKGAFYTPKEIVHYMCQESLVQYLKNYLEKEVREVKEVKEVKEEREVKKNGSEVLEGQLRRFLQHGEWAELSPYSGVLLRALRAVKVCDPAIGSGAFPMGILHEIFQCVERIHDLSPDETESIWELSEWYPAEVKLRIIQHSIYGVDIERGAVDIARLRFWLSIIVDERTPRTLPNLDFKIVVGDSLLGKFHPGDSAKAEVFQIDWDLKGNTDRVNEMRDLIERLGEKEGVFFLDPDEDKATLKREITALKVQLLTKQLEMHRDKFKARMLSTGRIGDLTAKEKVRAAEEKIQLGSYEETLSKLRGLAKDKADHLDYFDWKLDFPEVLNANVTTTPGFDIVIGNPPYVLFQNLKLSEAEKQLLASYYPVSSYKVDLFQLFIEQGVRLLNQEGVLSYITPNTFLRNTHAVKLRVLLHESFASLSFTNLTYQVFGEASVDSAITVANKNGASWVEFRNVASDAAVGVSSGAVRSTKVRTESGDYHIRMAGEGDEGAAIIECMKASSFPLREIGRAYFGIQVIDREVNISEEPKGGYRPILAGAEVHFYKHDEPTQFFRFVPKAIKSGGDASVYGKWRIVTRQIGEYPVGCIAKRDLITLNSLYNIFLFDENKDRLSCVLAIMNSRAHAFWWQAQFSDKKETFPKIKKAPLEAMPIPRALRGRERAIAAKVVGLEVGGDAFKGLVSEIDVLVCKLYGLSWEQAKVVDPQLALSKEAYDAIELPEAEEPEPSAAPAPGVTGLTDAGTLFGQDLEGSDDQTIRGSKNGNAGGAKHGPGRPAKEATGNGQASDAVLQFLRGNKGWHGKGAILEGSGMDAGEWNAAIKALLDAGQVERQGAKKGAKYRVK